MGERLLRKVNCVGLIRDLVERSENKVFRLFFCQVGVLLPGKHSVGVFKLGIQDFQHARLLPAVLGMRVDGLHPFRPFQIPAAQA